jgi:uncharacterized protein HemX
MSENESGGDSKFMTGFVVGFVVAVLICLGVGGSLFFVGRQREMAAVERARMEADRALAEAMMQRERTENERARAEKALRDAKAAQATRDQPGGKKEGPP